MLQESIQEWKEPPEEESPCATALPAHGGMARYSSARIKLEYREASQSEVCTAAVF